MAGSIRLAVTVVETKGRRSGRTGGFCQRRRRELDQVRSRKGVAATGAAPAKGVRRLEASSADSGSTHSTMVPAPGREEAGG